ncbi:MAG: extracellular solute-binding protein, partial [Spiroplasma sp.]|nr:extracellular solute-binding protein [Mycoplasmatales bacterium]
FISIVTLAGCSDDATSGVTIRVGTENTYHPYLETVATDFTAETGINVEIYEDDMFAIIETLATAQGNGPDVFLMPNDRIGSLSDEKLIAPLNLDLSGHTEAAQTATMYDSNSYMLPVSTDTTLLIYNKALVTDEPATLGEIAAEDIAMLYTDFYHFAGLLHDQGGYIFGDSNADTTDIGLNNEGSVKAGEIMATYYDSGIEHWTLMKDTTIGYDVMMDAFYNGNVSYVINGPWALHDISEKGIDYGIMPIPSYDGGTEYKPLTGYKGFAANAYSSHLDESQQFIEFMLKDEYMQSFHDTTLEVVPFNAMEYAEGSDAAIINEATSVGMPMPTVPEFGFVWAPMADATTQIANGANAKEAFDAAVEAVELKIAE